MCTTKTDNRYIKHVPLAPLSTVTRCEEKVTPVKATPSLRSIVQYLGISVRSLSRCQVLDMIDIV
jgi:hypothetical protein